MVVENKTLYLRAVELAGVALSSLLAIVFFTKLLIKPKLMLILSTI